MNTYEEFRIIGNQALGSMNSKFLLIETMDLANLAITKAVAHRNDAFYIYFLFILENGGRRQSKMRTRLVTFIKENRHTFRGGFASLLKRALI